MITNTGTGILTKYLLGQTSSYASHIAIGCGARPLGSSDTIGDYSAKESLDFEMLRIPIISRGYVIEGDARQIVFTGEMPSDSRYEISEVGIFPASENPSSLSAPSKTIFTFDEGSSEQWLINSSAPIPSITAALDPAGSGDIDVGSNTIFRANATNPTFQNVNRLSYFKNETTRFLNSSIFIAGNSSTLPYSSDSAIRAYSPDNEDSFISYTTSNVNLKNYGPNDKIKIAIAVINKSAVQDQHPDYVSIMIKFKTSDDAKYAVLGKVVHAGTAWDPTKTRYIVIEEEIQNIEKQSGFVWDNLNAVEIYATAFEGTTPSALYYVVLDGVRVENVSSISPVYGLVGYSVIKNTAGTTINKKANSSTLVEFRFTMDVVLV